MTNREFFNAILTTDIAEELKAYASDELAKLDARNEKRKNTPKKANPETEALKAQILEAVSKSTNPVTAAQVSEEFQVSTQKASALLLRLVAAGSLTQSEMKIKGQGKVKVYEVPAHSLA